MTTRGKQIEPTAELRAKLHQLPGSEGPASQPSLWQPLERDPIRRHSLGSIPAEFAKTIKGTA